jgi:hypothetical protein
MTYEVRRLVVWGVGCVVWKGVGCDVHCVCVLWLHLGDGLTGMTMSDRVREPLTAATRSVTPVHIKEPYSTVSNRGTAVKSTTEIPEEW